MGTNSLREKVKEYKDAGMRSITYPKSTPDEAFKPWKKKKFLFLLIFADKSIEKKPWFEYYFLCISVLTIP